MQLNTLAAVQRKVLTDRLGVGLRSVVCPNGVADRLISNHQIPVAGCGLPQSAVTTR